MKYRVLFELYVEAENDEQAEKLAEKKKKEATIYCKQMFA